MQAMRFDWRDMLRAPRLALSIQRIWIQFVGLIVAYIGYLILTYVSFITAGVGLVSGWKKFGLLPCLISAGGNWYSYLIFALAVLWLVIVYFVTSTAVARATYMLLKGNNFYTWREAFNFAIKKTVSAIMSPISLIIFIVLIAFGGAVIGWIGKIPFVGIFGITVFTPVWFFFSLLIVFMGIVTVVATVLAPAILATTDDDAFEAVFQSFSVVWSQPWRLIFYQAINFILAVFGFVVFAVLSKKAFIVMDRIFAATTGADYQNISAHAMYLLSTWLSFSIIWIQQLFGNLSQWFYFTREFVPLQLPGYQIVAAHIFALWFLLIGGFVFSYFLSSLNVGHGLAYLLIRKKKDDENLLERKDREEEEEEEEETTEEKSVASEESKEGEKQKSGSKDKEE